ncbi:MAG: 6-pyruvoyl trahydropterin synthase family protein [Planctomycetota bacterium]|jgi:6-pyruvoyltetrahydropterin/6-carboxytetrahydropterin synthase
MYELSIERDFCAAHAITISGEREPLHGHTWHVTAAVAGEALDADGLLCDFHDLEAALDAIIDRLHNRDLGLTPPFDETNPTAEHVARHIADAMARQLPEGVRLARVSVTEAPGCTATWVGTAAGGA